MIRACILTMNRPAAFKRCIESIMPAVAAAGGIAHVLYQQAFYDTFPHIPRVVHMLSGVNLGCAGGRRALVEWSTPKPDDIFVFLDDDLYATDDQWLETLIAPIRAGQADIAGVEPMRVTDDFYTLPEADNPDYVSGGWCAISARVFLSGVTFDTGFLNYYEDAALGIDAQLKGFRVTGVRGVGLHHEPHEGNADVFAKSREYFIANYAHKIKALRGQMTV